MNYFPLQDALCVYFYHCSGAHIFIEIKQTSGLFLWALFLIIATTAKFKVKLYLL